MRDELRVQVLGPVRLLTGDRPVRLGGPSVRGLLALLALEAGRVVALNDLVDGLWGPDPPPTARTIVHGNISALRGVLRRIEPGRSLIETVSPGYRLAIEPDRVDAHRARDLLERAETAPLPRRAELLAEAHALWQGPELADVAVRAPKLAELRAAVLGARVDADLELGRHAELVVELTAQVREHPRAERTVGQLMRALYYSGRRADALDVFREAARVSTSYGLDPGPELRELHEKILADELPAMTSSLDPAQVVPRQLPRPPSGLVGRAGELAWLDERPSSSVVVLTGAAGVGKSALAVWWAHRSVERFPDGTLFAALRGFDARRPPAEPAEVLAQFLLGLGVAASDLPARLAEREALYRSLTDRRRMLVVLDDARDAEQVRPLLPPGSMAMITSRSRLDGLIVTHSARTRVLQPLARADSVRLIGSLAGAGEHARLAELCGDLPLALRIVGARLAASPQWMVEELESERSRLAALEIDDTGVRAALDVSCRGLPAEVAGTFRVLGGLAGSTAGPHVVAAVEGIEVVEARRRLRVLAAQHLLTETAPDVFAAHDLVRLYQRELAPGRVLERSVRYYQAAADRARRSLLRIVDPLDFTGVPVALPDTSSFEKALAWFAAEWPNLLATCEAALAAGLRADVWRLARVAHTYQVVRPRRDEWTRLVGLGSAAAAEDPGRFWMLISRCALALTFEIDDGGLPWAREALSIAHRLGDQRLVSVAEIHLACALTVCGQLDEAIERLRNVLAVLGDDPALRGQTLSNCAEAEKRAGRYDEAIEHQLASLEIDQRLGDDSYTVVSLNNLAELHLAVDRLPEAERFARAAVEVARQRGFQLQEAVSTLTLARIRRALADLDGARADYRRSLDLHKQTNPSRAAEVLREMNSLSP
ncbi:tetratricopeptide repeat protein [Amycolatopsis sp. K13G38]|uniref:Tetratricopeptide repeat protein n=1 Tax=Amycolatopsis acididurans TaxID=2724524 RepID=A0ABX1J5N9_9PSEU|nr:BTAD domain-containing putative transcriptional regulator [Amycolatopsis acididurans]NKQ55112.1 tetratricopeptide repeat protein [Amycolatopsis acididurans]